MQMSERKDWAHERNKIRLRGKKGSLRLQRLRKDSILKEIYYDWFF